MCEAVTVDKLPLIGGGIPFLIERPGEGHHVKGELYNFPTGNFEITDALEGHPSVYMRKPVKVKDSAGNIINAQTYFYQREMRLRFNGEYAEEYPIYDPDKELIEKMNRTPATRRSK